MLRFSLSLAALALLLVGFSSLQAQAVRSFFVEAPRANSSRYRLNGFEEITVIDVVTPVLKIKQSGLLTARLSRKELERWKALERRVFAEGSRGEPLHPTLRDLWDWADHSGHVVYLQFLDGNAIPSSTAGSINIERFDPTGKRHTAVLRLCLSNIDQALISPLVARPNGFIPFDKLQKEDRYLEVLGHELAHIKYVLSSLLRAYLVNDLIENTNGMLLEQARMKSGLVLARDMKFRISQRDTLLQELEAQAQQVEEVVWQELRRSKRLRAEFLTAAQAHR